MSRGLTRRDSTEAQPSGSSRQRHGLVDRLEPLVEFIIRLCGWSSILFVFAIFFFVFREAIPVLHELSPVNSVLHMLHITDTMEPNETVRLGDVFGNANWHPTSHQPQYGILALIVGSLAVTVLSMLFAVPLGLGAAVFISEFCKGQPKEILKITIELLAAIPSVVWGFVGYIIIAPVIVWVTGAAVGVNLLNGSIALALMSVPVIVSVGEDALKAVPDSYREAALSLGANRWEMIYRVLFPSAKNGLLAAVLLGVGRAIGETMAVLMCTGGAAQIPHSFLDPVRTLTATIAVELGEIEQGGTHYRVLFFIGMVLFAITFAVNMTADLVVKGIRNEKQ